MRGVEALCCHHHMRCWWQGATTPHKKVCFLRLMFTMLIVSQYQDLWNFILECFNDVRNIFHCYCCKHTNNLSFGYKQTALVSLWICKYDALQLVVCVQCLPLICRISQYWHNPEPTKSVISKSICLYCLTDSWTMRTNWFWYYTFSWFRIPVSHETQTTATQLCISLPHILSS